MLKKLLFVLICVTGTLNLACPTATAPNNTNTTTANKTANLPPEFSPNKMELSNKSTPGIPDPKNVNAVPKGTTPTPGIPDPEKSGKTPVPKGATPAPGIPSPEEFKRQMSNTAVNKESVNTPPKSESDSIKSPIDRKRRVGNLNE